MCDPMTIAGIAATGLSTGLNYAASQKVEAARDDAMAAEQMRQQQLDREAKAVNIGAQDRFKGTDRKQAQKASKLGDYYVDQKAADPGLDSALPTSASNVTVAETNKQQDKAKQFTTQQGQALGQLRAFGDVLGNNSLLQGRDAMTVGQIGGFKTGSSNVLGYELDDANHAGDGMKLFGDIVGGIGGLTLQKGLSGANPAAAAPFKPTTSFGDYIGTPSSMAQGRMLDKVSVPGYARPF